MNVLLLAATLLLPPFGEVRVVDEVDCTKTDHDFVERPAGVSEVVTILGRRCRHVPVQSEETASMFCYRLGRGKGLRPNGSYVIVMDYPDDVPRNYVIVNRATDSRRGFSTGTSLGDAWEPAHVDNRPELVSVPQGGRWERWMQYTSLQDRTTDYKETQVAKGKPFLRGPEEGFDFVVAQYSRRHDPNSAGVAVSRILLCEIPDEKACYAELALPPAPLPQRRIFWREEMSDGPAIQGGKDVRRCADMLDWMRHKCRQMKMLGMNTVQKDLLEFGHVQHWEPDFIRPGWAWAADAESNGYWGRVVDMVASEYGFALLPYYEWYGNLGAEHGGKKSYGYQKKCEPLVGDASKPVHERSFTHIWWTETANLDVTDPEALEETKNLLRATILRYRDKARFAGAMFRTRPSTFPIGFADSTRVRFGAEANGGKTPTRDELVKDKALYAKYLDWWHDRRAGFLAACARYLREGGIKDATVVLDAETSEPGPGISGGGFVVDDRAAGEAMFAAGGAKGPSKVVTLADALAGHLYLKGRSEPTATWGHWEWQHACPADRPQEFRRAEGVALAMPVNRLYSVGDPAAFSAYAGSDGMTTVIRHHSLNEHNLYVDEGRGKEPLVGYDMNDSEKAGRASMMVEVCAMANGDVANLGYLIGSCMARGFPEPVREFNRNFLALPALPSKVVEGACDDPEVVLREIDCSRYGVKTRYYALVHVGRVAKRGVRVRFPAGADRVRLIVEGEDVSLKGNVLELPTLRPFQLTAVSR